MRDKFNIRTLVLGTLGFICLAYSVLLPRWYISVSQRQIRWLGWWMECLWGVELQCGVHSVFLGISIPQWIGTALALSALLLSGLAMRGTNCCGTNCCGTKCCGDNAQKKLFAAGCLYLISCLVTLGPVIWFTVSLGHVPPRDVGECLYLAWVSLGFLMAAGVLQLHRYSPCRQKEKVTHNCTSPLEHEGEVERCGAERRAPTFLKPEMIGETGKQEMVFWNKYERTAGDSLTEPVRKDSKRQYV